MLEIVDISGKDAGIGDGTIYIYVEVVNNTGKSLDYVQVDVGCRDASGSVVGTGIANYLGLAPGESAVLTGIVLEVPDCKTIYGKINPITN